MCLCLVCKYERFFFFFSSIRNRCIFSLFLFSYILKLPGDELFSWFFFWFSTKKKKRLVGFFNDISSIVCVCIMISSGRIIVLYSFVFRVRSSSRHFLISQKPMSFFSRLQEPSPQLMSFAQVFDPDPRKISNLFVCFPPESTNSAYAQSISQDLSLLLFFLSLSLSHTRMYVNNLERNLWPRPIGGKGIELNWISFQGKIGQSTKKNRILFFLFW